MDRIDRLARIDLTEVAVDEHECLLGIDVARERDRGIGRVIVPAKERADLVELGGLQIGDVPDRRPVIRMVWRKERRQERHRREAVRTILVVLPPLVEDDVALIRELGVGQGREQIAHAVRLHPERELERTRRNDFPVVRAVGVSRSVECRTRALKRLEEAVVVMLRSLEHQMLEEMREPGAAGLLVLRSDVIPDVHSHNRARVVLVQQDIEAVVQRVLRGGNVHRKLPQVCMLLPKYGLWIVASVWSHGFWTIGHIATFTPSGAVRCRPFM